MNLKRHLNRIRISDGSWSSNGKIVSKSFMHDWNGKQNQKTATQKSHQESWNHLQEHKTKENKNSDHFQIFFSWCLFLKLSTVKKESFGMTRKRIAKESPKNLCDWRGNEAKSRGGVAIIWIRISENPEASPKRIMRPTLKAFQWALMLDAHLFAFLFFFLCFFFLFG